MPYCVTGKTRCLYLLEEALDVCFRRIANSSYSFLD
jgi:hypothetical protein